MIPKSVVEETHFAVSLVHSIKELEELKANPSLREATKFTRKGKNFLIIVKDTRDSRIAGALKTVIYDDTRFDKVRAELFPFHIKKQYYNHSSNFPIKRLLLQRALKQLGGAVDEIKLIAHKADLPFFRAHPEFFKEQRLPQCFELKLPKRRHPIHQVVRAQRNPLFVKPKFGVAKKLHLKTKRH